MHVQLGLSKKAALQVRQMRFVYAVKCFLDMTLPV
jgi:hypothetical protein